VEQPAAPPGRPLETAQPHGPDEPEHEEPDRDEQRPARRIREPGRERLHGGIRLRPSMLAEPWARS
jgi:hypothetical protein